MKQEIIKIIQQSKGTVLGIGLDKQMVEAALKNDFIIKCDLLDSYTEEKSGKRGRLKTIKVKKINKYFKKKIIDVILCDYQVIKRYMNTFVKNSVYINRKKLYFFGDVDKELIMHRYQRYNTTIEFKEKKDGCIIIIDNEKAKNNKIKDIGYRIIDGILWIIDFIGDILMN